MHRQQRNNGWEAAAPNLLTNLRKGKFKPEDLEADGSKECVICYMEYTPEDTVVTLPCDTRHVFHE
jgi:hypothetical protein